MRKFESLLSVINENLNEAVRLDPKCWKGKKIGTPKTKMKDGVRVNNCVPKEAKELNEADQYKLLRGFENLPKEAPRGFWVKNGNYVIVNDMFGHDQAIERVFPELVIQARKAANRPSVHAYCLKQGFIHIGSTGPEYELTYNPLYASKSDIRLAKDIGLHYQKGVIDHFERYLD